MLGIDYVDKQDAERLLSSQPDEHSRNSVPDTKIKGTLAFPTIFFTNTR